MKTHGGLLISAILASPHILGGCATSSRPYGSAGPGETWLIADQQDTDADQVRASVDRQRGWGWETNYVSSSQDGGVKSFSAGPFAYAGEDPSTIEVSIWIFADQPMTGRVLFTATPEPGAVLQHNWDQPVVFPITMTKDWHSQSFVLPQFQGQTQSAHIQWITDGPTLQAEEDTGMNQD